MRREVINRTITMRFQYLAGDHAVAIAAAAAWTIRFPLHGTHGKLFA